MKKFTIYHFLSEYTVYIAASIVFLYCVTRNVLYEKLLIFFTLMFLVLIGWMTGFMIKHLLKKERPDKDLRLIVERDRYALPSMHTLTLSIVSTSISMNSFKYGVLLFVLTCIVMFMRVKTYMHDYLDVISGLVLGVILSVILFPYCSQLILMIFRYAQLG